MAPSDTTSALGAGRDRALEFLRVLWALHHSLDSASRKMKHRVGVTGRDRITLRLIGSRPGRSAGDLARVLHVHPSALTARLGRLVARGYVQRHAHPGDGRRLVLTLTPRGRIAQRPRSGTIEARVRAVLDRVPEARIRVAVAVLTELQAELGGEPTPPRRSTRG